MSRPILSLCAWLSGSVVLAQIPNAGFEQWDNAAGYNEPVGWTTFNPLGSFFGATFAAQGTPAPAGNSFIQLTAHELTGAGPMLSLAITGAADVAMDGFPWTTRPATLNGLFRFAPQGTDEGHVIVAFYKWDPVTQTRIGLGGGFLAITSTTTAWSALEVPITFYDPQQPDTATISLISGGGNPTQPGTVFDVDELSFQGVAAGIGEPSPATIARVFPSPAQEQLWWATYNTTPLQWRVLGLDGRVFLEGRDGGERTPIAVGTLSPGVYLLQTIANGDRALMRFVKG